MNLTKEETNNKEMERRETTKDKWISMMAGCYGPLSPKRYLGIDNENEARLKTQPNNDHISKANPNKKNLSPSGTRISLEDALAAEEEVQDVRKVGKNERKEGGEEKVKPLILLMEKTDREYEEKMTESNRGRGVGGVCRVCVQRKRNAAFIPCGHAFCMVCSRELWIDRRSCPICEKTIVEILDIL